MTAEIRVDRITSRTGINTLSFSDNGFSFISNTGIGTTNPTSKLTVLGNVDVTGVVTATTFVGALTGTASNVTTNANLTGDVTSTGNATAIAAGVIVDADINASAAIALSKLGTTGSINTSGIITATSFSGSGSGLTGIVNSGITTVAAGTTALPSISPTGDSNTGIFFPSADTIAFAEGGAEAARFDSSGRLLAGTSTARTIFENGTASARVQVEGTDNSTSRLTVIRNGGGGGITLAGTAGASVGSIDAVANNATLGEIAFAGSDGTDFVNAANISVYVDGTPGANDMPGRIVLATTADGASSPTERMRIDSSGRVRIGTTTFGASEKLVVHGENNSIYVPFARSDTEWISLHSGTSDPAIFTNDGANIRFGHGTNRNGFATERMRLDSSGRLLIGTSASLGAGDGQHSLLQIRGNESNLSTGAFISLSRGAASTATGQTLGQIIFTDSGGGIYSTILCESDGTPGVNDFPGRLVFSTCPDGSASPVERMRIKNNGIFHINTGGNAPSGSQSGLELHPDGYIFTSVNAGSAAYFNRNTNDGTIVELRQANTAEGTISVSGSTVSYNGAHLSRWSQLPGGAERTEILRGSVLSNLDEMCEWGEEDNEQLNRMKVSDVEGDKNVSGVFQAWDDDDDTYTNDFYCAMTGDFIIRIAEGVIVERGDLLMSAGDGTAKPQGDGFVQDKTIAKVTSTHVTCTYEDGSYCVPCVLMAC
jgi:hypothetical protein